jgi:hypothetical protein
VNKIIIKDKQALRNKFFGIVRIFIKYVHADNFVAMQAPLTSAELCMKINKIILTLDRE